MHPRQPGMGVLVQALDAVAKNVLISRIGVVDMRQHRIANVERLSHILHHLAEERFLLPQPRLRLPSFRDVMEVDRQAIGGGVNIDSEPTIDNGRKYLKLNRLLLDSRSPLLVFGLRADDLGKSFPDHFAEQFFPPPSPIAFRLLIDIGEAPVIIERIKRIAQAFQDLDGARVGVPKRFLSLPSLANIPEN